ncbi:MAG: hypothetical protein KME12_14090 [Trichocoleus desertorum ATA4-8-CV12]|jgi:hypothetical protein|uniref:hypothetical protein n=1 Tax=Trichocoleus desertorum TaxID=1481672 RepID=UPI0025B2DB7F|nr:hypothetical protein [Trichocoleus desertorum]MBW4488913.1 hypothetical protein [Trichocoleus desertorum ATA4-8-CV12]
MIIENVAVKPETRNHKGFFVQETSYKLVGIDQSGWALICIDDAVCHYVDPDDLSMPGEAMNDLD